MPLICAVKMLKKFLLESGIPDTVPEPSIPLAEATRTAVVDFDFALPMGPSVSGLPPLSQRLADRGYFRGAFVRFVDPELAAEEQAALQTYLFFRPTLLDLVIQISLGPIEVLLS
jgi:hypothetical protein